MCRKSEKSYILKIIFRIYNIQFLQENNIEVCCEILNCHTEGENNNCILQKWLHGLTEQQITGRCKSQKVKNLGDIQIRCRQKNPKINAERRKLVLVIQANAEDF